jgi:hypothetical protein
MFGFPALVTRPPDAEPKRGEAVRHTSAQQPSRLPFSFTKACQSDCRQNQENPQEPWKRVPRGKAYLLPAGDSPYGPRQITRPKTPRRGATCQPRAEGSAALGQNFPQTRRRERA